MRRVKLPILFLLTVGILNLPSSVSAQEGKGAVLEEGAPLLAGPKKTVAVADFKSMAGLPKEWDAGHRITAMLIDALKESGCVRVIEQKMLHKMLTEKKHLAAEIAAASGIIRLIREKLNAHLVVTGTVTEFREGKKTEGREAEVAFDMDIYNPATGDVIDSSAFYGRSSDRDARSGRPQETKAEKAPEISDQALLDIAAKEAVVKAVHFIAINADEVLWQGKIVMIKEGAVFINAGLNTNILPGDTFSVYRLGEALIDPDTAEYLGSQETKIGEIEAVEVEDKFSKTKIVAGGGFRRNDIVRYE